MTLRHPPKTPPVARLAKLAAGTALGLALVAALLAPWAGKAHAEIAAASAAMAAEPATAAGPALWVIKDADSTIYLFGTVHVLRPTTGWESATGRHRLQQRRRTSGSRSRTRTTSRPSCP
jgi:hypothetical protein